jgi:hypothetical protein
VFEDRCSFSALDYSRIIVLSLEARSGEVRGAGALAFRRMPHTRTAAILVDELEASAIRHLCPIALVARRDYLQLFVW